MEDSPRISQENDEPVNPNRRSFDPDLYRRGWLPRPEMEEAIEDDDDDDDDEAAAEKKSSKKSEKTAKDREPDKPARLPRLERADGVGSLLPVSREQVPDDDTEAADEAVDELSQESEADISPLHAEDILESVIDELDETSSEAADDSDADSIPDAHQPLSEMPASREPAYTESAAATETVATPEPSPNDMPRVEAVADTTPEAPDSGPPLAEAQPSEVDQQPAPESLAQILERRANQERVRDVSAGGGGDMSTETGSTAASPNTPSPPEYRHSSNTGPLLAVDYLGYKLAKNRDKKNMKIAEKGRDALAKEQKHMKAELEERILSSQKQQEAKMHTIPLESIPKAEQSPQQKIETIYNSKPEKAAQVPKYAEQIPVIPISEKPTQAVEKVLHQTVETKRATETFENTLRRLEQAQNSEIQSERVYERRHEVKDEPGSGQQFKAVDMPASSLYEQDPAQRAMQQLQQQTQASATTTKASSGAADESVYAQAAVTGFWGAVVGIIIFGIIYMLGGL